MPKALDVIGEAKRVQHEARERYEQLVRDLAADKSIDAEDVLEIVAEADATLAELEAAVERRISRVAAAKTFATLPKCQAAHEQAIANLTATKLAAEKELSDKLADLERQRVAATTARDKRIATAQSAHDAAADSVSNCESARLILIETSSQHPRILELRQSLVNMEHARTNAARSSKLEMSTWRREAMAESAVASQRFFQSLSDELATLESEALAL